MPGILNDCFKYVAWRPMPINSKKSLTKNTEINKLKGLHADYGFIFLLEFNQLASGNFKILLLL